MKVRNMAVGNTGFVDPHCIVEMGDQAALAVRTGSYYLRMDAEVTAAADATHVLPVSLQSDGYHVTIGSFKFSSPMRLVSPLSIERGGYGSPTLTGQNSDQWRPVALSAPVVVA